MDEREQRRKVRHRLAVLRHADEVTGNVAATCRYYGISRPTFYKWQSRFEEHGEEGLRDKSSQPHTSPRATRPDVVGKIMYLRQHYHFGPMKISMYLARYHDITISPSGVYGILKRLGMNRLPTSQRYKRHDRRWRRYEKPQPGHRVHFAARGRTAAGCVAARGRVVARGRVAARGCVAARSSVAGGSAARGSVGRARRPPRLGVAKRGRLRAILDRRGPLIGRRVARRSAAARKGCRGSREPRSRRRTPGRRSRAWTP